MSARYVCSYERRGDDAIDNYANLLTDALIRLYKGTKADLITFREFLEPYTIKTEAHHTKSTKHRISNAQ